MKVPYGLPKVHPAELITGVIRDQRCTTQMVTMDIVYLTIHAGGNSLAVGVVVFAREFGDFEKISRMSFVNLTHPTQLLYLALEPVGPFLVVALTEPSLDPLPALARPELEHYRAAGVLLKHAAVEGDVEIELARGNRRPFGILLSLTPGIALKLSLFLLPAFEVGPKGPVGPTGSIDRRPPQHRRHWNGRGDNGVRILFRFVREFFGQGESLTLTDLQQARMSLIQVEIEGHNLIVERSGRLVPGCETGSVLYAVADRFGCISHEKSPFDILL